MRGLKTTIGLVVVLGGLFAYIYFVTWKQPEGGDSAAAGTKLEDPADAADEVTGAIAAWVTETIRESLDGDDEAARGVVKAAARERRHMLHAAGFLSALPWELEW